MGSKPLRALVVAAVAAGAIVYAACGLTVTASGPPRVEGEGGVDSPAEDAGQEGGRTVGEQECTAGRAICSGACTDTTTDPANCGACAKTCNVGEACSAASERGQPA